MSESVRERMDVEARKRQEFLADVKEMARDPRFLRLVEQLTYEFPPHRMAFDAARFDSHKAAVLEGQSQVTRYLRAVFADSPTVREIFDRAV